MNADDANATADELTEIYGVGIGVAGTGISSCGPAIGLGVDITNRESIQAMIKQTVCLRRDRSGHCDRRRVCSSGSQESLEDDKWKFTFDVNVRGSYNVVDEIRMCCRTRIGSFGRVNHQRQWRGGEKGSLAYDTSKAAANHLVRELAIEMAPLVRVNAVAPATVVAGSTMFRAIE